MLEGTFNQNIRRAILRTGVFCYKTSDKHQFGVPDFYVTSGIWMECKVLKVPKRTSTEINILKPLTSQQRNFMRELYQYGDRVLVCYSWKNSVIILPYSRVIREQSWRISELDDLASFIPSVNKSGLGDIFGAKYEKGLNNEWYIFNS